MNGSYWQTLTFKLRGWPPRNYAGAPKVQKTAGRKENAYGQSLSNAGLAGFMVATHTPHQDFRKQQQRLCRTERTNGGALINGLLERQRATMRSKMVELAAQTVRHAHSPPVMELPTFEETRNDS